MESSIDDLLAYCRKQADVQKLIMSEVDEQPTHADAGAKGGRGHKAGDIVTSFRGNGRTHTLKRLKRDAPALFSRVVAGELSANAAAIEAGFRKKLSKFDQIVRWLPELTAAEKSKLREMLS